MSNEQRMCICGHQRRTHDRRNEPVEWGGCWGIYQGDGEAPRGGPPRPCPCEGFMWVKSLRGRGRLSVG